MSAHADPNSAWSGKKALLSTCYRPSHCKPVEKRFLPYSWKQIEIFSVRIYQGVTELCKFSWGSYERTSVLFHVLICRQTRKSYSSSFLGSRRLAWIMGASEQKIRRATFFFSIFARPPSQFSLVRFFANPPLCSPPTNLWLLKLKQFNTAWEECEMFLAILILTDREQVNQFYLDRGRLHLRILIVGNRWICSDYRFDRHTGDTATDHVRSVYCNLDELRLTSWLTIKQFLFCKILTELSHKTVENVKEKKNCTNK